MIFLFLLYLLYRNNFFIYGAGNEMDSKIVVFDLDLTISSKHTYGLYKKKNLNKQWDIYEYMTETEQENMILILKTLRSCGYKIYLCSRGELCACYWFLIDSRLINYFDGVYGSITENIENYPILDKKYNTRFQVENSISKLKKRIEKHWEYEKVRIIKDIICKGNDDLLKNVLFFDDEEKNVTVAVEAKIDSFQVDIKNKMSLIELLYTNISCLKDIIYDATEIFGGSVTNGILYFQKQDRDRNKDVLKIKIRSKRFNKYYSNTGDKGEFILHIDADTNDINSDDILLDEIDMI